MTKVLFCIYYPIIGITAILAMLIGMPILWLYELAERKIKSWVKQERGH